MTSEDSITPISIISLVWMVDMFDKLKPSYRYLMYWAIQCI